MNQELRVVWKKLILHLHQPFRLSTGTSKTRTAYWIRLADDQGWGEGTIPPYYQVDEKEMQLFWDEKAVSNDPYPDDPEKISDWVGDQGPAPARAAVDLALYDRIAKSQSVPVYKLLGVPKPSSFNTAFTIGIDTPQKMASSAASRPEFPVFKLKLGSEDDIARVAAVRQARPDVRLYVDANAGWSEQDAVRLIKEIEPLGIDMIEQPVPGEDIDGMGYVQRHTRIPVVADESLTSLEALERIARAGVRGINLKLMKLGGFGPTLALLNRGRELGLKIMLGCMTETSLGVTAMAHLSALADWHDLDAPLLISNDPFAGVQYTHTKVTMPDRPGIGALLRE